MTVAQAAAALAPRVVWVRCRVRDLESAVKRVRRPICNHEMTVAVEVDVRSLGPCLECLSEVRNASR